MESNDRVEYDRHLGDLRTQLGEAAFTAAWSEGLAMPAHEAIDDALAFARMVSRQPQPPDHVADLPGPGLTRRERDVIRLLVDGRSDREIAGELFISTRTASNHVRNIMNKLGVDNRTAAATYAVRQELA